METGLVVRQSVEKGKGVWGWSVTARERLFSETHGPIVPLHKGLWTLGVNVA